MGTSISGTINLIHGLSLMPDGDIVHVPLNSLTIRTTITLVRRSGPLSSKGSKISISGITRCDKLGAWVRYLGSSS
jgi:hypothetical protein